MFKKIGRGVFRAIKDILPIPNSDLWKSEETFSPNLDDRQEKIVMVISQFIGSAIALYFLITEILI